jgi:selenocysteine lyase/cysteine desulfurase
VNIDAALIDGPSRNVARAGVSPTDAATHAAAPISRHDVIGADVLVPLLDGRLVPYVNLDNAASTPALRPVVETVREFLPYYSGVHRGTGYKSRLSTEIFESARSIVGEFVGADPERDVVVFTNNTTDAINKVAHGAEFGRGDVVLTTGLEHHSNDLPWRQVARTEPVAVDVDGTLDLGHLDLLLRRYRGKCALLAVSGASNVTGVVQPIHELAAKVHAAGGRIFVDAAQLAPHRPIDMRSHDDPGHLDFVGMSAHKMYAPFGTGVLVGPREAFGAVPHDSGGGTVAAVTADAVAWADLPDREEAGSPNVVGAVATAAAAQAIASIGFDEIVRHERRLTGHAIDRLAGVPGVRLHGPAVQGPAGADRVGVITFTVDELEHGLVAAVLGYEHGVGVRSGCFCAHPYVAGLLGLDRTAAGAWLDRAGAGDKRGVPGLVRISIGCYNEPRDIDVAVDGLERLMGGDVAGRYAPERDGSFHPIGYAEPQLFALR